MVRAYPEASSVQMTGLQGGPACFIFLTILSMAITIHKLHAIITASSTLLDSFFIFFEKMSLISHILMNTHMLTHNLRLTYPYTHTHTCAQ